jgi:hypothetical protein
MIDPALKLQAAFIRLMIDHGTESAEVQDFLRENAANEEFSKVARKALDLKRRVQNLRGPSGHRHGKDMILEEMKLIRRGIELAHKREKHPSFATELQSVLQTADVIIQLREFELAERDRRPV